ncbi:uncharacterized protein TM35_000421000, partial [Trypanosoma theileri]
NNNNNNNNNNNKENTSQWQQQEEKEEKDNHNIKTTAAALMGVDSSLTTTSSLLTSSSSSSRVVLYGVDLNVQPCHLHSILEQLVGRRPLSVFRPAAELWQSIRESARTNAEGSSDNINNNDDISNNNNNNNNNNNSFVRNPTMDSCLHLGLHDVHGAGGVVVLELPQEGGVVTAAIAALNGACVNGRRITATVAAAG